MAYVFESDPHKAEINRFKHGVTFAEAQTAFGDLNALSLDDDLHSGAEDRYFLIGYSDKNRLLAICYTERGYNVKRLINARKATAAERELYEGSN